MSKEFGLKMRPESQTHAAYCWHDSGPKSRKQGKVDRKSNPLSQVLEASVMNPDSGVTSVRVLRLILVFCMGVY